MSELNVTTKIGSQMKRKRECAPVFDPRGEFALEHWRDGKCIGKQKFPNGITDEGKKKIFDLYFLKSDTTVPDGVTDELYIGLINTGSTLASGDTYVSHAGWTEFTSYTVSALAKRGEWIAGAATGTGTVSITNASPVTFDFTGSGTVDGIFVCSGVIAEVEAQSDATAGNKLWSTGDLAAPLAVVSADQLKITYTVNS